MKNISHFLTVLVFSFVFAIMSSQPSWAEDYGAEPTEKNTKK